MNTNTTELRTQWNTGRKYVASGQRIVARWDTDGLIKFNDLARGIWGQFPAQLRPQDAAHLQRIVMDAYDNGRYSMAVVMRGELDWQS